MRNLVIGTDGTWNKPDQMDRHRLMPSNVVKFIRAVDEDNTDPVQVKYYDTGVGTSGLIDKYLGGFTGNGLFKNMREAYSWILSTHQGEDRLFLLGFSRGAFTARSLAGMLGVCGIPAKFDDPDQVAINAARIYRTRNKKAQAELAAEFRKEHECKPGKVHFIGVWDTVGALGLPSKGPIGWLTRRRHAFHDVTLGSNVCHACHAVAIHERRAPFEPALWRGEKSADTKSVTQAWFPGVHTNVGGGYADAGLSDRALDWMIAHAQDAGLAFNQRYLERRIDPNWFGELRDSMQWFYRTPLTGLPCWRSIGTGALGECLHVSATRRWASPSRPDSQPENLSDNTLEIDETKM